MVEVPPDPKVRAPVLYPTGGSWDRKPEPVRSPHGCAGNGFFRRAITGMHPVPQTRDSSPEGQTMRDATWNFRFPLANEPSPDTIPETNVAILNDETRQEFWAAEVVGPRWQSRKNAKRRSSAHT